MDRDLGTLVIWIATLALLGAIALLQAPDGPPPAPETCYEDEACWDCATMGNLVCGPEAVTPTTD